MPITVGTISDTAAYNTSASTHSHNNNGDYLVVGVASILADSGNPTGVTYNAVAMTLIDEVAYATSAGATLWGLVAPASGANDVVVTWASGSNGRAIGAISFSGVDQTVPTGTPISVANGGTTAPSVTVAGATDDLIVDCHAILESGSIATVATVGASQTQRVNRDWTAARKVVMSTEPGAASVVMDWSLDQSCRARSIGVAIKPAAASGGATLYLTNTATADGWGLLQIGGAAPSTATGSTGWDMTGVAVSQHSRMAFGTVRASGTFAATAQPSGGPDNTLKDCFRTSGPVDAALDAGGWDLDMSAIAVTIAGAGGRFRARLWRSANADGSTATEITAGAVASTSFTNLLTSAAQTATLTFTLGAVSFTGQYLFLQLAAETV